jgi:hypothetical protein
MDDDVSMTGKLSLGGYEKQEKKLMGYRQWEKRGLVLTYSLARLAH